MEQGQTILKSGDGQNTLQIQNLAIYDNRIWNVKVSIFIDTKVSIFKGTTPAIIVYLYN